jgi:hypothetical protein
MKQIVCCILIFLWSSFAFSQEVGPYKDSTGLWGLKYLYTADQQIVLPAQYDYINYFSEDIFLVKRNSKSGLIDRNNSTIVPVKYDHIEVWEASPNCASSINGYLVRLDGKYGIVEFGGKELVPPVYYHIQQQCSGEGRIEVWDGKKYGFIDGAYQLVIPCTFDQVLRQFKNERAIVSVGGKKGVIDTEGNTIIPFEYDRIKVNLLQGNLFYLVKPADQWGMLDESRKTVIPFKYDNMDFSPPNDVRVMLNNRIGLLDYNGKKVAPTIFDKITNIGTNGSYLCELDSGWRIIRNKKTVLDPKKYEIDEYNDHFIQIKNKEGHGVLSPEGKVVVSPVYHAAVNINHLQRWGFAEVQKNKKSGIIDLKGEFLLPIEYDQNLDLGGLTTLGYTPVKRWGKWGMLDTSGTLIIPTEYKRIDFGPETGSYIIVKKKDKWGILTPKGQVFVPVSYSYISGYCTESKTEFKVYNHEDQYGMIDASGQPPTEWKSSTTATYRSCYVSSKWDKKTAKSKYGIKCLNGWIPIPYQYEKIKYWDKTFAAVKLNGMYGFIDGNGKLTAPHQYEKVKGVNGNWVSVRMNDKFGIVDKNGKVIVPCLYKKKLNLSLLRRHNALMVTRNGYYGVIDSTGKEVVPCEYVYYIMDMGLGWYRVTRYHSGNYKYGLINIRNQLKLPASYSSILLENTLVAKNETYKPAIVVNKSGDYQILDMNLKPLNERKYESIKIPKKQYAFYRDSNWYYLNQYGKEIDIIDFQSDAPDLKNTLPVPLPESITMGDEQCDCSLYAAPKTGTGIDLGTLEGTIIRKEEDRKLSCICVRLWQNNKLVYATVSDENGKFLIEDIPPGFYKTEYFKNDTLYSSGVRIRSNVTTIIYSNLHPTNTFEENTTCTGIFSGRLNNEKRESIPLAKMQLYLSKNNSVTIYSDLDGQFNLGNIPQGVYSMKISTSNAGNYLVHEIPIDCSTNNDLNFRINATKKNIARILPPRRTRRLINKD